MTELTAVNRMLNMVQEAPVNAIDGALPSAARRALSKLREVSRDVQTTGWSFNTDVMRVLSRDEDNEISLPEDTLSLEVDFTTLYNELPVQRGGQLYDSYNHTYVFGRDVTALELIVELPWDDLPPTAQTYIVRRAAREFQAMMYGDSQLSNDAILQERVALKALLKAHGREKRPNMIYNTDTWAIIGGWRGPRRR